MTATDDRVSVWVFGTIVVAAALLLSPMAVTALPDDPLSGTGTDATNTTNTTLDTETETLTFTPTTTTETPTLEPTGSTTETTPSTDTVTDEVSAPTPTPTETIAEVESTVEDGATSVVEDVNDGTTTTEVVDTGDATDDVTETRDTLTEVSTDSTDTGTNETTTVTVPVDSTDTADLTATPTTETTGTTDSVDADATNTASETLETTATTTEVDVTTEPTEPTDAVVTTEQTPSETQEADADEAQTSETTAATEPGSSESADAAAVANSASGSERRDEQRAAESTATTPSNDSATALLPPISTVPLPEPVAEEPGIALGFGALVTAGAVRYGPAIDWSSFGHVANQAASPVVTTRLHAGIERVTRIIAPFRYSRFDDSDPLEHEGRDAVFSAINESPGIYLSAVAERADVPLSTARHHLRVLEDEQLISGAKIRGKRRFYSAHTEGHELVAALNDEATATVLDALSRLGPASVSALASAVGRDPSTITHHLQRLEADGIVVREREGRAVVTRLSQEANAALRPEPEPAPSARLMADGSGVEEGVGQ
ncbi:helix-turn-helix domain-containing protein [Haladaptatus sp. DJG-WS-42]|uniref:winged helix-turn-helix transcriptional regulator n=1 Tax=Haladaptatus sp. DJG-WS-42 TaxID=3120516 RepID=UPI0030CB90DD